jgi:hypothetical protein
MHRMKLYIMATSDWTKITDNGIMTWFIYDEPGDWLQCEFKINNNEYIVKFDNRQICCEQFGWIKRQFNTDDVNSFKLDYNRIDQDNSQFILDFEIAKIVFFNYQNMSFYNHAFEIYKNGEKIFVSSL